MSLWSRAASLADRTPASRDRYVDFLRAMSMLVVTVGHWLAAAPYLDAAGAFTPAHIFEVIPWTTWLTWVVQVMPIFFIVGGYANGVSWHAAQRDGKSYAAWLESRLRRLVWPLIPLLVVWTGIVAIEYARGVRPDLIQYGSQAAFIPIWFLAVYILIVLLVPVAGALWRRFGMWTFWALAAAAIGVDLLYFLGGLHWLGYANYLLVWGAISVLGFAWLDDCFSNRGPLLLLSAAALALLLALVLLGPYPVSMVGATDEVVSNTTPPKVTLIILAIVQGGVLFALQGPARRWLAGRAAWTTTVLINGAIMTLFIWHLTATTLVVLASYLFGGVGLALEPGTGVWWWSRILWILANIVALAPLIVAFGRFERPPVVDGPPAPTWRYVAGAIATVAGLFFLAGAGVGGYGPFGLNVGGLAITFLGIGLISRFAEVSDQPP